MHRMKKGEPRLNKKRGLIRKQVEMKEKVKSKIVTTLDETVKQLQAVQFSCLKNTRFGFDTYILRISQKKKDTLKYHFIINS